MLSFSSLYSSPFTLQGNDELDEDFQILPSLQNRALKQHSSQEEKDNIKHPDAATKSLKDQDSDSEQDDLNQENAREALYRLKGNVSPPSSACSSPDCQERYRQKYPQYFMTFQDEGSHLKEGALDDDTVKQASDTTDVKARTSIPQAEKEPLLRIPGSDMDKESIPVNQMTDVNQDHKASEVGHSLKNISCREEGHLELDTPPASLPASSPSSDQSHSNDRTSSPDPKTKGNEVSVNQPRMDETTAVLECTSDVTSKESMSETQVQTSDNRPGSPNVMFELEEIDGIQFKAFETEEDMNKFTEKELKVLEELNKKSERKMKQMAKTTKPTTASAFMSSSLDDILAEAKNSCFSLKPSSFGAPPKSSKIYDMGILAKGASKHLEVKKSVPTSTWTPMSAGVSSDSSGSTAQPTSSQKSISDGESTMSSQTSATSSPVKKRQYIRRKPYVNWRRLRREEQLREQGAEVGQVPALNDPDPCKSVITKSSPVKDSLEKTLIYKKVQRNLKTPGQKEDAFKERILQSSAAQRSNAKLLNVSFMMDKSYVEFALEALKTNTPMTEPLISKRGRKRKEPEDSSKEEEGDYECEVVTPTKRKKNYIRGDEVGIANMISRHSGRSVRLPARYHGNVVGNLGVIPDSPITEKPSHAVITEKKARKTLLEKQKRLSVVKTTFKEPSSVQDLPYVQPSLPTTSQSSHKLVLKQDKLQVKQFKINFEELERQRQRNKLLKVRTRIAKDQEFMTENMTKRQHETLRENACFRELQQQLLDGYQEEISKVMTQESYQRETDIEELQRRICMSDAFTRHLQTTLTNKDQLLQEKPDLPFNIDQPLNRNQGRRDPIKKSSSLILKDGVLIAKHNRILDVRPVMPIEPVSQPLELRELYRQLYLINDPKREKIFKKQGIKPRVNKQNAVEEAIQVIQHLEEKKNKLNYIRNLFILWNDKLRKCVNVIEDRVPTSLRSSPASKKRKVQVVHDVYSAYLQSCCYEFSKSKFFSDRKTKGTCIFLSCLNFLSHDFVSQVFIN